MPKFATTEVDSQTVVFRDGMPAFAGVALPRITTVEEAHAMGNAMVASDDNYPPGMSPCEVAGINDDQTIVEHCIFDDTDECRCEELLGFPRRDECTLSDHPDCLVRNATAR